MVVIFVILHQKEEGKQIIMEEKDAACMVLPGHAMLSICFTSGYWELHSRHQRVVTGNFIRDINA